MGQVGQVYSFPDIQLIINPAQNAYPPFVSAGSGVGSIIIDPSGDVSTVEATADGAVFPSKLAVPHRTFSIKMMQTSSFNTWMQGLYNLLYADLSTNWLISNVDIISLTGSQQNVSLTQVMFKNDAGHPFEAQAQYITWNFIAANKSALGSIINSAQSIVANIGANL